MPLELQMIARHQQPAVARNRFLPFSSAGLVALLLLSLFALPLTAQPTVDVMMPSPIGPPVKVSSVEGFVTSVDGTVLTLLGTALLRVDIAGATIISVDAGGVTTTPVPIDVGAYVVAMVSLPAVAPPFAYGLPPPLKATSVAVRPAGMAVLAGEIDSVGSSSFSLLFRTILVDGSTAYSGFGSGGPVQGFSDLKSGMQATTWVVVTSGGLLAKRVVAYGQFVVPKPVSFRGVVTAITSGFWQVDGTSVAVTPDTKIVGDPIVGDTVDVLASETSGVLTALMIAKIAPVPPPTPGRTFTFDGTVQSMPSTGTIGFWKIGDRSVIVNGLTKITGTPAVGSVVTVTGYPMPGPIAVGAPISISSVPILATTIVTKS